MKSIVTTDITASAAAKIKKGTLDHINAMASEAPVRLAISLIGEDYDNTKAYILYGCEDSNASATVFDMSAGLVLYGEELFYTPAQSITVLAGQTIRFYPTIDWTSSPAADPVTFTDGTTHNIHLSRDGVWMGVATGSGATLLPNMLRNYTKAQSKTMASYGSNVAGGIIYIKKSRDGKVSLTGNITFNSFATATETVCTLPSGCAPLSTFQNIAIVNGGDIKFYSISNAGVITLTGFSGTLASKTAYFDNISFYTY